MNFSLEDLESAIARREHEDAGRKLLELLTVVDSQHGSLAGLRMAAIPGGLQADELERLVATRLAGAIGTLFSDPAFSLSDEGFISFVTRQRWISAIFASTPFRNADHAIRAMGAVKSEDPNAIDSTSPSLLKACALYLPDSDLSINCDELWYRAPRVCASLLMALLSPRLTISPSSHAKREMILGWLPTRLDQLQTAAAVPGGFIHDVWMHCSYGARSDKHAVKAPLNRLIRRQLLDNGLGDVDTEYAPLPASAAEKPALMVMMEWFHSTHSVYRTHSRSLIQLRERFKLIGVGMASTTDDRTRAIFDEFVALDVNQPVLTNVSKAVEAARVHRPQIVYYLGVGMFPHTIYAATLRLAPMQCVALGHAASTFSPVMDYFLIDEDYIGSVECFSEKVVALPIGSMPFTLPDPMPVLAAPPPRTSGGPIKVAVAASSMKLNPEFLSVCRQAKEIAGDSLEIRFVPAFALGITYHVAKAEIQRQVPGSVVFPHMDYASYMAELQRCDMSVNPFPYGNMNSIVDTVIAGLGGLCVEGREPHAAIDAALFRRLGLEGLKVANDPSRYAQAIADMVAELHGGRFPPRTDATSVESLTRATGMGLDAIIPLIHAKHPQFNLSTRRKIDMQALL